MRCIKDYVPILLCISIWSSPNGYSDTRMPIAVIDSGLDIYDPRFSDVLCQGRLHRDFTGEGLRDLIGHGTHVTGIIAKAAPDHTKYCIVVIKAFDSHEHHFFDAALAYATSLHVPIINISASGQEYAESEKQIIVRSQSKFVVAAGNDNDDYKNAYPAGYNLKNIYVIGNWDCNRNKKHVTSNYGDKVIWRCGTNIKSTLPGNRMGYMTGTSMAVPLYTAELINQSVVRK